MVQVRQRPRAAPAKVPTPGPARLYFSTTNLWRIEIILYRTLLGRDSQGSLLHICTQPYAHDGKPRPKPVLYCIHSALICSCCIYLLRTVDLGSTRIVPSASLYTLCERWEHWEKRKERGGTATRATRATMPARPFSTVASCHGPFGDPFIL